MRRVEGLEAKLEHSKEKQEDGKEKMAWEMMEKLKCNLATPHLLSLAFLLDHTGQDQRENYTNRFFHP